jgi:raffinose/stachyose/melibiose transport system permease protein
MGDKRLRNAGNFALFLGPSLFVFVCVLFVPLVYGVLLTFTNYSPITETRDFVGISNYIEVFSDKVFIEQFGKTLFYVFSATLLCNLAAFLLAYILTGKLKLRDVVRTGFFTPNLIGGIVLGYIWKFIFANVLTQLGKSWGYAPLSTSFLTNPERAIWAMIIVTVWQYAGYYMIIYIAGFVGIPKDIQEASEIDGATGLKKTLNITIPLMVPSFIICLYLSISRCFMTYDMNLALTAGGPYGSSQLASMHIYQKAFQSNKYALGQTEAIVLFVAVALVAVSQVLLTKRFEVEA